MNQNAYWVSTTCLIKSCTGENTLMIGSYCDLGGRPHPQIAWAKLRALRDGAIVSKKLWS